MSTRARGAVALFAATRPKQWPKNLLVAVGAGAAGGPAGLLTGATLLRSTAFVLAAASVYLHNDVVDRDLDRMDPQKAGRSVANGTVSTSAASLTALVLAAVAIAAGSIGGAWWPVALYLALNVVYTRGLKNIPWLETLPVSIGFPLRVAAGAGGFVPAALVVLPVAFGIVIAKRHGELLEGHRARPAAEHYRIRTLVILRRSSFLVAALTGLGTVLLHTSCLPCAAWAAAAGLGLVVALLRFETSATRTGAARPDQTARRDPVLIAGAALWAVGTVLT